MKFPWAILSMLSVAALVFGLLLGIKSIRITETEIIDFYADEFVRKMNKKEFRSIGRLVMPRFPKVSGKE